MDRNQETAANRPPEPAKKTVLQSEQEVSAELDTAIKNINDTSIGDSQRQDRLTQLGEALKIEAIEQLEQLEKTERQAKDKVDKNKIIDEKKQAVATDLRRLVIASTKGIEINNNQKTQQLIERLAKKQLDDDQIVLIFQDLQEYLIGKKEITLTSSSDEQISGFEEDVLLIQQKNPEVAQKIIDSLIENANLFGKEKNEVKKRFGRLVDMVNMKMKSTDLEQTIQTYFPNFAEKQKVFLRKLHEPEEFLKLIETQRREISENSGHIEHEIKEIYRTKYGTDPSASELASMVDRQIRIEISEEISNMMVDVYNQLYARLNIEGAHKTFDETEKEDFMHGIEVTRFQITRALQHLDFTFREMEEANPNDPRLVKMFRLAEEDKQVVDIDYKGNMKPMTRLRPLPYFKEENLANFMINQMANFGHWREKTSYLHDTHYIFGHPPHEGVFYKGLGDYAEKIKGVDLDGIMNLPDGKITLEAFQLYEKFFEDALAKIDYKIDATMLQNQYEEVNTLIGKEIREYLILKYGKEIPEARLLSAVKNGVGMAKGVFLTEPEKLALTDPTDHKGRGAFQSYGTNDAGALMALNPLHLIMRWQSDANLRQVFFLEADGEKYNFVKNLFGVGYDHRVAWKNAAKYFDSFTKLEHGREGSQRNLVIDKILNIGKAAGIYERDGWRDFYQFESHFIYNEKMDGINLLDSFKAMDVIGYEGVNWFLKNIDNSFYQAYDKTYMEKTTLTNKKIDKLIEEGLKKVPPEIVNREKLIADNQELINQRETLFKHIYEKYFTPFSSQSYEDYVAGLKVKAIKLVKEGVVENKTLPFDDYDMAVQKQISNLFVKGTISRFVAARFPTKFLRMDRDRYQASGKSRWRQIYEALQSDDNYKGINRDQFDQGMKDVLFAEMLLRSETSDKVQKSIHLLPLNNERDPHRSLGDHQGLLYNLDRNEIGKLLRSKGLDEARINKAVRIYDLIREKFIGNQEFLDGEAVKAIEGYPFSFGVENTDMKLIAYRGTGPRMIARQIKDIAEIEEVVIKGFVGLPDMFKEIAKNGDYSPLIKYLKACQSAFVSVHGVGDDYEFNYMVCGMLTNYLRKDEGAKDLFGLGGVWSINSIAGEIAGNSNSVREWDSRDIDRFFNDVQREGLLPGSNIEMSKGPEYENIWKIDTITQEPKMTGNKKRLEKYKFSIKRARERFGGDLKAMGVEAIKEILPMLLIFVLWQYLKKAFEESFGAKKG